MQLAPCRKEGQEMVQSMQPLREMIHDHVLLDLLQRMFHYNPKSRMTAEKVTNMNLASREECDKELLRL